ncbi:MAG: biotin--protein ligase [Rhodanobacter sp.]
MAVRNGIRSTGATIGPSFQDDRAMHGEYKMPGGKLVVIDLDVRDGMLVDVRLSGDFFMEPDGALHDIDAALEGLPMGLSEAELAAAVNDGLGPDVMMYGISSEAIAVAVRRAVQGGATHDAD